MKARGEIQLLEHSLLKMKALSCNPNILRNNFQVAKKIKTIIEQKPELLMCWHFHFKKYIEQSIITDNIFETWTIKINGKLCL
jgi:hypothetical protein